MDKHEFVDAVVSFVYECRVGNNATNEIQYNLDGYFFVVNVAFQSKTGRLYCYVDVEPELSSENITKTLTINSSEIFSSNNRFYLDRSQDQNIKLGRTIYPFTITEEKLRSDLLDFTDTILNDINLFQEYVDSKSDGRQNNLRTSRKTDRQMKNQRFDSRHLFI